MKPNKQNKPRWETIAVYAIPITVSLLFALFYIWMQMTSIYGGDAGDLVASAYIFGIPHPPGYPFYTFLSGILIRIIPYSTVAWRACLMSSIPMAVSLYFIWRLCYRLTRSIIASTAAVIMYGLSGPVWLNAITQEVFGLFSLFSAVFLERCYVWFQDKKQSQLYLLAFWSGLALTHHTLIVLFIVPAIVFVFIEDKVLGKQILHNWWKIILFGCIGMIPYIYAPIVSYLGTPLDFEHAATLNGFFRLITRASYGTFQASASVTPSFIDRLLNIYTFFHYIFRNFGFIGIVSLFIGIGFFRRNKPQWYMFIILCLLFWIIFFFIAGFPQLTNYHIGTIERFFIVPYQLIVLFIACGIYSFGSWIASRLHLQERNIFIVQFFISIVLFSSILTVWKSNYSAYTALKNDRSMEQMARDMMQGIPENSIVDLFQDTTTYAFYYTYYVLHERPDIKFIKIMLLGTKQYRNTVKRMYPELYMPSEMQGNNADKILSDFLSRNSMEYQLFTDEVPDWISGGTWIPYGLFFTFFPSTSVTIDHTVLMTENELLWSSFLPPMYLLLYQRQLPMLSDVLRIYAQKKAFWVKELVIAGASMDIIEKTFRGALRMEINVLPESYMPSIVELYTRDRCEDAKQLLDMLREKWGSDGAILEQYHLLKQKCSTNDIDVIRMDEEYLKYNPQDAKFFTR